ncbi:hypothetical protein CS0771_72850 [Catellatospora sp. IY07-71]|uniref:mechanosensitive ion channel family protein n=1 Tax=Catellatospora sp. IY07-71 TaxID=2728827 RepID=UPI001BB3E445|nr:hypothetical protein [Catellatospora sp. IY07-71]BCJ77741.1 hypothetical protein CS0771_72850 [Catellatospora sp. IY07-71]
MNPTLQVTLGALAYIGLKILACAAILVIGWIIAKVIGTLVDKGLAKVRFNHLAQRTGMDRWTGRYTPSGLVGMVVYYALLLFTFQLAFSVFGPNPISNLIDDVIAWLPRLIVACVIIVVAVAIANAVFNVISNALSHFSYGRTVGRIAQVAIIALGAIAALNQAGIATTITTPVLVAILATISGILIVGVGGGLIGPMRSRWERALGRIEEESTRVSAHLKARAAEQETAAALTKARGDTMVQPKYPGETPQDVKPGTKVTAEEAADRLTKKATALRNDMKPGPEL